MRGTGTVDWIAPEGGSPRAAVLLLHGIAGGARFLGPLARRLRRAGFSTAAPAWDARAPDVEAMAAEVAGFFPTAPAGVTLHVVAHSMGGIAARAALDRLPPPRLGRLVTLGTPHGGTLAADLAERLGLTRLGRPASSSRRRAYHAGAGEPTYPIGTVGASLVPRLLPHDGTVSLRSTRAPGAAEHLDVVGTHLSMLVDPRVARRVVAFLDGRGLAAG